MRPPTGDEPDLSNHEKILADGARWRDVARLAADTQQQGAKCPWRRQLATRVKITNGAVTKLITRSRDDPENFQSGGRNETLVKLGKLPGLEFAATLLNLSTEELRERIGDRSFLLDNLLAATTSNDYADACLALGGPLRDDVENAARTRRDGRAVEPWRAAPYRHQRVGGGGLGQVPLHEGEQTFLGTLLNSLSERPRTAVVVDAYCQAGVGYVLHRLVDMLESRSDANPPFGAVLHLYVDSLNGPKDALPAIQALLKEDNGVLPDVLLAETAGGPPSYYRAKELAQAIADHVGTQRSILIIHGASALVREARTLVTDICDALLASSYEGGHLVLTDWLGSLPKELAQARPLKINFDAGLDGAAALSYFRTALAHYRALRAKLHAGAAAVPEDGSPASPPPDHTILKRVEHLYTRPQSQNGYLNFPSAVRWRALLASHTDAPSPFDPTAGARAMIAHALGLKVDANNDDPRREGGSLGAIVFKHVPEFECAVGDVVSDIRRWRPLTNRSTDLNALRLVSTGLWWLTDHMIRDLRAKASVADFMLDLDVTAASLRSLVQTERVEGQLRARTPLLIKAVIQEDWASYGARDRFLVHRAIADVLAQQARHPSPKALARELPLAPPRGQVSAALALEAIRHSVRAARSAEDCGERDEARRLRQQGLALYYAYIESHAFIDDDKPKEPTSKTDTSAPDLPRRHGLFSLKLEVMCLLSADGLGAVPPKEFDGDAMMVAAFHREVGICLLREGRAAEAIEALMRACTVPALPAAETGYALAHLCTAQIESSLLDDAETTIAKLGTLLESGVFEPDFRRQQLEHRLVARSAALRMAREDFDGAIATWMTIRNSSLTPFEGERAILALDALMRAEKFKTADGRSFALEIAERARNAALDAGRDFEALRISIRRAELLRRMDLPKVAEAILDHVGLDLGRYGGSKVAFWEWLMASARVVRDLDAPAYAFATYAWPAFLMVRGRQAGSREQASRKLCEELLHMVEAKKGIEELRSPADNAFWNEALANDLRLLDPWCSFDLHPPRDEVVAQVLKLRTDPHEIERFQARLRQ